ncbi:ribonuclease III [bacterium]|nr:ribonuclease III [bacterium]
MFARFRDFFKTLFLCQKVRVKRESIPWDSLCREVRYKFSQIEWLEQAMSHRSSTEHIHIKQNNERLEFLGDAVLGWVVTDYLFRKFPNCNEGDLTRAKSMVVSRENLAKRAKQIKLGRYLILGTGEDKSGGRVRRSILANAYEALIGAIYLDGGAEEVQRIIQEQLLHDVEKLFEKKYHHNYKSWLLEHVQALHKCSPKYRILNESGPDHRKEFTVEVILEGHSLGKGRGNSKKKAEQAAAEDALKGMGLLSENSQINMRRK